MAKVIAACGAIGGMGGAVASRMLEVAMWVVKAITRDIGSENSRQLKAQGAEVVGAFYDDINSMMKAFEGRIQ